MKKNIVIFGFGYYGKNAYWNLKDKFNILFFADNDEKMVGTDYEGVRVVRGGDIVKYDLFDTDIVICSIAYYEISAQLEDYGILEYYVMLEGFLYHSDKSEFMMPVEINKAVPYKKSEDVSNILFVQNMACSRTHKIAKIMKETGYEVNLLYTLAPPYGAYASFMEVYDNIWCFSSPNGICDFINAGEFDIIHTSNEPDILSCILQKTNKRIVSDVHDLQSIRRDVDIDTLALEYISNKWSDGHMYTSTEIAKISGEKYSLNDDYVYSIGNYVDREVPINGHFSKLSALDGEIHCVYEGGVVGNDRNHHRFFDEMWRAIVDAGTQIHFYSQSDRKLCMRLEGLSPNIHYEGSLAGDALINEMSKYDIGLALFNVTDTNRLHLEGASINKVYEYLNAGLPICSFGIMSLEAFLLENNVGAEIDFSKDILYQIKRIVTMNVQPGFLEKKKLTMLSHKDSLKDFYHKVMDI